MKLFEGLNESQKEAASHLEGAMLILAGAGSGKTKTITTRLAYLIDEVGIDASQSLTLTFTNKAANVMKSRALALIQKQKLASPLLCTFHKFGLLFLRLHIEKLGRKNDFLIIDSEDKKRIVKELVNEDKKLSSTTLSAYISKLKNEATSVEDFFKDLELLKNQNPNPAALEELARVYKLYEAFLLQNNLVDFDDLLLLTSQILNADEVFKKEQSRHYQYIMVDEYQDTNALQYAILQSLCATHQNIVVVGDDDQSIYAWRGARIENILNFQKQFDKVKLVKLEHNYRSSSQILKAANTLIANNETRLGKTLISTKDEGEEVQIIENFDEKAEASYIASKIKKLLLQGIKASEIALLYRVNALSRSLEEAFMREKIPFKILSGIRFYERAEIKDMISYLRLIHNPHDDFSFKRIINRPKRGFGNKALEKLENLAKTQKISLFQALQSTLDTNFFSAKLNEELKKFANELQGLRELSQNTDLKTLFASFEKSFGLKEYYENLIDGEDRVQNMDEFFASLKEKARDYESLDDILNEISLLSDQDDLEGESVFLMSIHASKGLEFDYVFIIGLEEGFFPLQNDINELEEERRLAYVAITRAKKGLFLSYTHSRFFRGSRAQIHKSRFLDEITNENKDKKEEPKNAEFKKGDLIKHKIFGIGRVISVSNKGELKLGINFGGIERTLLASFVEKIS
ncbi:ATP-dependent DNA helicase [Campylobacter sp. MIT 12-8780]|uniref:ATP-dependent helicase n=1 Tax=unclassified Campylobacter TaxID=2593542 RepID=UPI00115CFEA3|nr:MULTISPECIES: UvrD-helicase domain-containing protein [unclassified Campylobacter]NDJ26638.1 UvrD-helicase domain-containing protein [Campylobacter sp. MIT 19-121]TQR42533.1 ATP-dependent DNA helicase [Campylobacter sp. MIT 12-8780]